MDTGIPESAVWNVGGFVFRSRGETEGTGSMRQFQQSKARHSQWHSVVELASPPSWFRHLVLILFVLSLKILLSGSSYNQQAAKVRPCDLDYPQGCGTPACRVPSAASSIMIESGSNSLVFVQKGRCGGASYRLKSPSVRKLWLQAFPGFKNTLWNIAWEARLAIAQFRCTFESRCPLCCHLFSAQAFKMEFCS